MNKFLIYFLPVFLLDIFTWRDVGLYLGKDGLFYEDQGTQNLYFQGEHQMRESLSDVSDFFMNKNVFTGKTSDEYFIIARKTDQMELFHSEVERNQALMRDFSISLEDLSKPPWYAAFRDLQFYPYNFIYYTILIGIFLKPVRKSDPA